MRLEWTEVALEDREAMVDFIARDNARAAVRTDHEIETQALQLIQHPLLGRVGRVSGTRELVIRQMSYIAVYQVEKGAVRVLRVLHGAQQWPLPL